MLTLDQLKRGGGGGGEISLVKRCCLCEENEGNNRSLAYPLFESQDIMGYSFGYYCL